MNITRYDHVGIRITDAPQAVASYAELGFRRDPANSTDTALEMVNAHGVRLNLILNGVLPPEGGNVLLDRPQLVAEWLDLGAAETSEIPRFEVGAPSISERSP